MTYEPFETFKSKLLTFFSNEIIHCNHEINKDTVDIYFSEYNIVVQVYDGDEDKLGLKEFEKNTRCMPLNINLNRPRFDSFAEIIKIKTYLIDMIKNKSSDNETLITRLNNNIKKIHDNSLEYKNLIV